MRLASPRLCKAVLLTLTTLTSLAFNPASANSGRGRVSLENGVYAVLKEVLTPEQEPRPQSRPTLLYDQKYSPADQSSPPRYVTLDASSFVPLVLAGPPEARKDDRGWTLLQVSLAPEYVKRLENFTRAHLGGRIAVVIDGDIITIHTVRSVIKDGKAQITRCTDDACSVLRLKLTH